MCHLYFYCIFLLKLADTVTELPNATLEGPAVPGMRLQDAMNTGDRKVVCRQDSHCMRSVRVLQKSKRSSRSGVAREGPGAGPPEDRAEDRGDGYR